MLNNFSKQKIDWVIVICVLLLSAYGIITLYSATYSSDSLLIKNNFQKQIVWMMIGFVITFAASAVPPAWLSVSSYTLYFILLGSLVFLDVMPGGGGPRRWLGFGAFQLQPSEFMKPVMVLTIAAFLSSPNRSLRNIKNILIVFMIVLVPLVLVLKQPDLGTSLTFIALLIPMLFWSGLDVFFIFVLCAPVITFFASFNYWTFFFIILIICGILILAKKGPLVFASVFLVNILVGIAAPYFWNHLHEYQQQRVLTFLGLVSDPQGSGYQIIQSKIAIGSGGFLGKGFLHGSQTQLSFLPAQHTDFIFSVLAEEWGFIGSIIVLITFLILMLRGITIAATAKNAFTSMMAIGIVTVFVFQLVVNMGMTMGIMPVTGMPLPFISYGGSSMLTCMFMAGLLMNASTFRYK